MLVEALALGLIVGSFANVVIHRLPRQESVVWPNSRCPRCRAWIRWYDNIPLLSFLVLRGRCRDCAAPISWRYPIVEALTAALFVQSVAAFGLSLRAAAAMVLGTLLLIVFFIDLDHFIIPNRITYPGIVVGLGFTLAGASPLSGLAYASSPSGWRAAAAAAVTALALGLVFVVINVLSMQLLGQEGMGMGDAKLVAMIGAFLGWPIGAVAVLLGVFVGGVVGVCLLVLRLRGRREHIPFGPALAAGAVAAMWWGSPLLHWYVSRLSG
jgi:leader peptidase (prepilin peptidase) / N-methyltransferase